MSVTNITKKHIRRSPYQAIAAILIMFLTFLLVGMFSLASIASVVILKHFESKPQITAFFSDDADSEQVQTLISTLEETGKVESIQYISKEDALKIYQEQNKDDPLLLEMVTADILPASLEVSAKEPRFLVDLEELISKITYVEEVVYQKDVVEGLIAWTNAIRISGLVLTGLLVVVSIFTVMTIVSLKIALKKQEIEILNLIGASPWYIRGPFILEGGFYGVVGASIAWLTIMVGIIWVRPFLLDFLGIIPIFTTIFSNLGSMEFIVSSGVFYSSLFITGLLLGMFGSFFALNRYLKI